MQLLPMASSPDGLISARYAVITKTPGWGGGGSKQCPTLGPLFALRRVLLNRANLKCCRRITALGGSDKHVTKRVVCGAVGGVGVGSRCSHPNAGHGARALCGNAPRATGFSVRSGAREALEWPHTVRGGGGGGGWTPVSPRPNRPLWEKTKFNGEYPVRPFLVHKLLGSSLGLLYVATAVRDTCQKGVRSAGQTPPNGHSHNGPPLSPEGGVCCARTSGPRQQPNQRLWRWRGGGGTRALRYCAVLAWSPGHVCSCFHVSISFHFMRTHFARPRPQTYPSETAKCVSSFPGTASQVHPHPDLGAGGVLDADAAACAMDG